MTYGVCIGCGAVAWELLTGDSDACMGCDPHAYQPPDECDYCDCGPHACQRDDPAASLPVGRTDTETA